MSIVESIICPVPFARPQIVCVLFRAGFTVLAVRRVRCLGCSVCSLSRPASQGSSRHGTAMPRYGRHAHVGVGGMTGHWVMLIWAATWPGRVDRITTSIPGFGSSDVNELRTWSNFGACLPTRVHGRSTCTCVYYGLCVNSTALNSIMPLSFACLWQYTNVNCTIRHVYVA